MSMMASGTMAGNISARRMPSHTSFANSPIVFRKPTVKTTNALRGTDEDHNLSPFSHKFIAHEAVVEVPTETK
jgi:hypothetical protein